MSFDQIFLTLFLAGWALCGIPPWLAASVLTRGNAGLVFLPVSMGVAVLCGMLVPFLGATGVGGIWLSFAAAVTGPSLLLAARRFAASALDAPARAAPPVASSEPRSSE